MHTETAAVDTWYTLRSGPEAAAAWAVGGEHRADNTTIPCSASGCKMVRCERVTA